MGLLLGEPVIGSSRYPKSFKKAKFRSILPIDGGDKYGGFMGDELSYIKYVEDSARRAAEFGIEVSDGLLKDATTLANIVIVGAGAGVGLAISLVANNPEKLSLVVFIASSVLWLSGVATLLVFKCIRSRDIYAPALDCSSLLFEGYEAYGDDQKRLWALEKLQLSIESNRARNSNSAYWLDICRFLALFTPVFAILLVLVFLHEAVQAFFFGVLGLA